MSEGKASIEKETAKSHGSGEQGSQLPSAPEVTVGKNPTNELIQLRIPTQKTSKSKPSAVTSSFTAAISKMNAVSWVWNSYSITFVFSFWICRRPKNKSIFNMQKNI